MYKNTIRLLMVMAFALTASCLAGCVLSGRHCFNVGPAGFCIDGDVRMTGNVPIFGDLPEIINYRVGPQDDPKPKPVEADGA